ncbi:hypothetical protein J2S00_002373 [Caldalkalibacillus uzonensis]|uniref:Uncharacterized protein n=1 Tax=Caldalkalibacillus uzonensis TaxID=353224 RepID=A0ABU0CVN2_9BACI|nr:hypothetical protein [Caldalkalibacillus uzonensis]MDQ0339585.1 hypothetical protein [Caldalkalibacillus uzonensis]
MWTKAGIALGIFILLLSSAWYADQTINRFHQSPLQPTDDNDNFDIEIQQVDPEQNPQLYIEPVIEPFKPREYIRIYELPLP